MFCERCGAFQPISAAAPPRSAGVLARRLLDAVGLSAADGVPRPGEDYLRLCLKCRGYTCPTCWNDEVGLCQTCVPLPEPEPVAVAELEPEPIAALEPEVFVAVEPEPEPVAVAEPEVVSAPVVVAEPEPEPAPVVVEPEPEPEPAREAPRPRLPILPVPPRHVPQPALPPLPEFPIAPVIQFDRQQSQPAAQSSFPSYTYLPPPQAAAAISSPAVRPCRNCQLSLSARANFCRRCGSAQPD